MASGTSQVYLCFKKSRHSNNKWQSLLKNVTMMLAIDRLLEWHLTALLQEFPQLLG